VLEGIGRGLTPEVIDPPAPTPVFCKCRDRLKASSEFDEFCAVRQRARTKLIAG